MTSRKLKLLSAIGAAALIVAFVRAVLTYSARADLTNASRELVNPPAGQIIPSRPHGILACGMPVSDCEKIIMMIPMTP